MATGVSIGEARQPRVTEICLAFPGASHEVPGKHVKYTVGGKTFAYFTDDHHGDGIVSVWCRVLPGDHKALAASDPERFYLPPYLGPKGWVAMRLDRGRVNWGEVKELLETGYRLTAPKPRARKRG